MKVRLTFDFGESERRAIAHRIRKGGPPATHHELGTWIRSTIRADLQSVVADYENDDEKGAE